MRKNENFWEELFSTINKELENIKRLKSELREISQEKSLSFARTKGSIFHDFYTCCERIFRRISATINGGFPEQERWHKELLYRMTISIKNIRPPVISEEIAAELDDYLSFRHIFRNIYGFELRGERLDRLAEKFEDVCERFKKEIKMFLKKMSEE